MKLITLAGLSLASLLVGAIPAPEAIPGPKQPSQTDRLKPSATPEIRRETYLNAEVQRRNHGATAAQAESVHLYVREPDAKADDLYNPPKTKHDTAKREAEAEADPQTRRIPPDTP